MPPKRRLIVISKTDPPPSACASVGGLQPELTKEIVTESGRRRKSLTKPTEGIWHIIIKGQHWGEAHVKASGHAYLWRAGSTEIKPIKIRGDGSEDAPFRTTGATLIESSPSLCVWQWEMGRKSIWRRITHTDNTPSQSSQHFARHDEVVKHGSKRRHEESPSSCRNDGKRVAGSTSLIPEKNENGDTSLTIDLADDGTTSEAVRLKEARVVEKRTVDAHATGASKLRTWFGCCHRVRVVLLDSRQVIAQDLAYASDGVSNTASNHPDELSRFETSVMSKEAEEKACSQAMNTCPESMDHQMQMPQESLMRFNSRSENCKICCDDVSSGGAVLLGCSHGFYCTQCLTKFAQFRLDNGIVDVPCPDCGMDILDRDLTELLPSEMMTCLVARKITQKAVASGAIQRACPTPNCLFSKALKVGSSGRDVCPKCCLESCWLCGAQPFHDGRTCEQHAMRERVRGKRTSEDSFYQWMQATGTRQCPKCQMAVSKENLARQTEQRSECHKMLCRNCGTRFCFKCLAVLTDTFTCGCSNNKHGFIDPFTGDFVGHLRRGSAKRSKASASNK